MLAFNSACKIEDTPFPFPYVQLVQLMDWVMTIACPVVIASWMIQMVRHMRAFLVSGPAVCARESIFRVQGKREKSKQSALARMTQHAADELQFLQCS